MQRYVLGASGAFGALNTSWTWDAFLQESAMRLSMSALMDVNKINLGLGMDSVANPANGLPICRSSLTNPTNGCVPYNPFGIGVNNTAANNYVFGTDYNFVVLVQDQMGANFHGEPFSTWAGPVSLATGFEWRRESANGRVPSPVDAASGWFNGNFHSTIGHYDVTEGYVETVVPLAKNASWAQELDLNAAARVTGYSVSGIVNTWKVGLTYQPIDDLRFRSTYSRDIREPTVGDLYQAGVSSTETGRDTFNNNRPESDILVKRGNLNLKPEKSSTFEVGAVFSPSFLPGFNASADYYEINVINAISTGLNGQQTIDQCFTRNDATCGSIVRNSAGEITTIFSQPLNVLSQNQNGLDLEASYDFPLSSFSSDWSGTIALRGLGTAVFSSPLTNAGLITDAAGTLPLPKFKYNLSATYADDPYTVRFSARGVSSTVYSNLFVTCTSACPTSTPNNPTYSENYISPDLVFDLALTYDLLKDTTSDKSVEAYFTVTNLFDKDPPVTAADSAQFYRGASEFSVYYDRIGRQLSAGIRFKL
jgi:outer membrane receptor protein involved in Fe transport